MMVTSSILFIFCRVTSKCHSSGICDQRKARCLPNDVAILLGGLNIFEIHAVFHSLWKPFSLVGQYVRNYLKPINNMSYQFQLDDDCNVDETIKCIRLSISIMFTPWVIARCSSFDSGACWAGQLWLLTMDDRCARTMLLYNSYTTMRIMRFIPAFHWVGRIFPRHIRNVL